MVGTCGIAKKYWILIALVVSTFLTATALYVRGYYQARNEGLFVGEVETFVPYGGTPSGRYEIKPIGYLSLGIHPDAHATEPDYENAILQLRLDQARSRELWPYYKWLAQIEERFH